MSSAHSHEQGRGPRAWWVARPENTNKVIIMLSLACAALVVFDFAYHHMHHKHAYFSFETLIGFHAAYGFVAFTFVVLAGKQLRKILMRPEDYYDIPYEAVEDDHHHDDHGHESHGHDHDSEEKQQEEDASEAHEEQSDAVADKEEDHG